MHAPHSDSSSAKVPRKRRTRLVTRAFNMIVKLGALLCEGAARHGRQKMSEKATIGVTGLAVMGRNLARNLARHGHTVALHNRSAQRTRELVEQFGDEGNF